MTKEIFREDSYLKASEARVLEKYGNGILFNQTVFYPQGGGQPGDTGKFMRADGSSVVITDTIKTTDGILHIVDLQDNTVSQGDEVVLEVDWERRYQHMRMHTALHALCSLVEGAVTGGSIGNMKSRLDFDIPGDRPDKEVLTQQLMEIVRADHKVACSWISDEELEENPSLVRTMSVKPPTGVGRVRMIRIGDDVDFQPCGGTHIRSTSEIGKIKVSKIENKGRQNRRINLTWDDEL